MGSHPSCDRPARALAAEAVMARVLASDSPAAGAAGARWNHESVDVSSIFLIISAGDSTGTLPQVMLLDGR